MSARSKTAIGILLAILAVAGNYFSVQLFNNVEFLFGSIAALVGLRILGLGWGCAIAFIGATVTYLSWGHPWSIAIFTIEIAVIGVLMRFTGNIVLAATAFWSVLGIGLVLAVYGGVMGMPFGSSSYIALKQAVNGVMNAVAAALLLELGRRFLPELRKNLPDIWFSTLIFYVMIAIVMTSATMFIVAETRAEYQRSIKSMSDAMRMIGEWTKRELEAGTKPVFLTDSFDETLRPILRDINDRYYPLPTIAIGIVFENGRTLPFRGVLQSTAGVGATYMDESGLAQWEPGSAMPAMTRARRSVYVATYPLPDFPDYREVRVEISAAPLIDTLESAGRRNMLRLAIILLTVMFISRFLTRWLTRPTSMLADASVNILKTVTEGRKPAELPTTGIHEFEVLSRYMSNMSSQLAQAFGAQRELNETLEERVKERTAELDLLSQIAKQTTNAIIVTNGHLEKLP